MRTTVLNPTVWLLAALCVAGIAGALRGRTARGSVASFLHLATTPAALFVLVFLALFGIGSRAVLGFLSPGAYAEEVVAARTFLEARDLYAAGDGAAASALADPAAQAAAASLPWLTTCQGNAIESRARFFTEHAHTPMLLLAGVPAVYLGGAQGLYLLLLLASLASVGTIAAVLIERAGLTWRSRAGLLVIAAVAGWQPVLAGIRQGDAVLPAAGLVALAWYLLGRQSERRGAAIPAAIAACLAVPAIGVLPALWRTAPRAATIASALFLAIVSITIAVAGVSVVPGFIQTAGETARTYADAPVNYAIVGRALKTGAGTPLLTAIFAVVLICSWWRSTTVDTAFATFGLAGMMIAPVLWSQHLALLAIPLAVLFIRIWQDGSSLALAGLAALALTFSLPDTIAIRAAHLSSTATLFAISSALVAVWLWTVISTDVKSQAPVAHPVAPRLQQWG